MLTLYMHPLASFCWKTLIALYENDTPFEPQIVDLGDDASRAAFLKISPVGKFPVLRDHTRGRTIPESSIIIEYLTQHYPGRVALIPGDPERALQVRLQDRFFDLHVHEWMQRIVGDRLRPVDKSDPFGVEHARAQLEKAYGILEAQMSATGSQALPPAWAVGDDFSMADCAAAPALFYANMVVPLGAAHPNVEAYLGRLKARPSFARTLHEAAPYFRMFPG